MWQAGVRGSEQVLRHTRPRAVNLVKNDDKFHEKLRNLNFVQRPSTFSVATHVTGSLLIAKVLSLFPGRSH